MYTLNRTKKIKLTFLPSLSITSVRLKQMYILSNMRIQKIKVLRCVTTKGQHKTI